MFVVNVHEAEHEQNLNKKDGLYSGENCLSGQLQLTQNIFVTQSWLSDSHKRGDICSIGPVTNIYNTYIKK